MRKLPNTSILYKAPTTYCGVVWCGVVVMGSLSQDATSHSSSRRIFFDHKRSFA
jgi:hypothetical protein